jgi:hypothetical protein
MDGLQSNFTAMLVPYDVKLSGFAGTSAITRSGNVTLI